MAENDELSPFDELEIPRSQAEISKAHDMLNALTSHQVDFHLTDEEMGVINVSLATLCWVLNHDSTFGLLLTKIRVTARKLGMKWVDDGGKEVDV